MNRGVLGTGPDANKRKRPDAQAAYISSMMHGNPKLLLSESPLFEGLTQHQLPFSVYNHKAPPDVQYQARIRLEFPDGTESFGIGVARTKKESERVAAIDACQQLQERGLLVSIKKSSAASAGWGDNPKNTLVNSVAFRDVCCGGNARALPITLRSSGPDHAKTFVAELTVPLRNRGEVFIAVGQGPNKAEAERACCTAACEKLHDVGLLQKPSEKGANPPSTTLTTPTKASLSHQQNEMPAVLSFRIEELSMMEDALQRFQLDNVSLEMGERDASVDVQRRSSHVSNGILIPKEQLGTENAIMRLEARKRSLSQEFAEQRRVRQSLPAWRERQNVVDAVSNHRVVVLTGETGCGKTTQVPQYVLEEAELQGSGAEVHIVVTQPRRIAAISVAERVAWERGEALGKSVGYAIRLDSCPPRARGSILYCTTGILLHRLQRADGLAGVSHVIIDEVHERDLDTDFLLVVIRELLNHNPSLRVVVMSATLDASVFTRYFGGCPLVNIPGMTYPVKVYNLDDLPQLMGRNLLPPSRPAHGGGLDEEDVDVDLVVSVTLWVSQVFAQGDGAILCFLPGWDTISIVRDRLLKARASRSMMIVPLHSQLPAGEQRAAFARAPSGMRKVVLATNIAETSVTIDDIVYVVDSGKIKEKQYDVSRNLTTMRVQWTSQASTRQRQGRAGRVQAGFCFQLYSQATFLSMLHHQIPEMQRVPLEELCLQIKAILSPSTQQVAENNAKAAEADIEPGECRLEDLSRVGGAGGIASFLSKAIQPPSVFAVHTAIQVLQQLGAIDQLENLTPLGKTLARLTVHPRFGKMLVYGALLGCLDPLLTIAAAACFRDPFVSPLNRREEADNVRASFGTGLSYGSDQLAFVNAFQQWKSAESDYRGHTFCDDSFLVFTTMKLIAGMRTQFERTLRDAGLCEPHEPTTPVVSVHLARSLLAAGLYPNIVRSEVFRESKGMRTATKHAYRWRLGLRGQSGRVFLHPTSVLSEKNLNSNLNYHLVFQEKVQTSQVFVRGCTLLPPLAMVLLGWNVFVSKDISGSSNTPPLGNGDWMLVRVEGWLHFFIEHRAGLLLLQLRHAFDLIIARWVSGHVRTESERQVVECVVVLLQASCHDMLQASCHDMLQASCHHMPQAQR